MVIYIEINSTCDIPRVIGASSHIPQMFTTLYFQPHNFQHPHINGRGKKLQLKEHDPPRTRKKNNLIPLPKRKIPYSFRRHIIIQHQACFFKQRKNFFSLMQLDRILIYTFNHIRSNHPPCKVANPTTMTLIFFPHKYIQSHKVTSSCLQSCKTNHNDHYIFFRQLNGKLGNFTLLLAIKPSSIFGCKTELTNEVLNLDLQALIDYL